MVCSRIPIPSTRTIFRPDLKALSRIGASNQNIGRNYVADMFAHFLNGAGLCDVATGNPKNSAISSQP